MRNASNGKGGVRSPPGTPHMHPNGQLLHSSIMLKTDTSETMNTLLIVQRLLLDFSPLEAACFVMADLFAPSRGVSCNYRDPFLLFQRGTHSNLSQTYPLPPNVLDKYFFSEVRGE